MANIYVRELSTDKVIHTVDVGNKPVDKIEKVMMGMLRNMDTDRYYIDDSEVE